MQSKVFIIQHAMSQLEGQIQNSSLSIEMKKKTLARIYEIDINLMVDLCERATSKLTKGNVSYILCFVAGVNTKVIARIFNVEPASVHTSRYRLRARFPLTTVMPF